MKNISEQIKSLIEGFIAILNATFPRPAYDQDPVTLPMNAVPANNLLNAFCLAIQKQEGWFPGSRSFRNKSPGNLKYAEQTKSTGKDAHGFAIFSTYEDGLQALKNQVLLGARGKSKVYRPTMNLYQFFEIFSPSFDNNDPHHYADVVATAIKQDPKTFKISQFLG